MLKLAKKRMSGIAVIGAILFMIVQVMSNLYLPNLTADIVNNGVAKGDIDYIWATGMKMILFALLSILASVGNVFWRRAHRKSWAKSYGRTFIAKSLTIPMMKWIRLGRAH